MIIFLDPLYYICHNTCCFQAVIVGPGNELGKPINVNNVEDHIFGLALMKDWSGIALFSVFICYKLMLHNVIILNCM